MAHPKIESDALLEKLFELFRATGYDGASLGQLAEATGLKKASLYHRFPNGKEQMAASVLTYANEWIQAHILAPLHRAGDPETRLAEALTGFRTLYDDGRKACLLRAFSLGSSTSQFSPAVGAAFQALLDGLAHLARDYGHPDAEALRWAENTVVALEGALVVAGAMQKPELFQRALDQMATQVRPK